jgi:DNA-binding FadR family transcriptional regulator
VEITLNGIYVKEASTYNLCENLALLLKRRQVKWRHIAYFRSILDCNIASLAAQNSTGDDISDLESLLKEGDDLLEKESLDWKRYLNVDIKIHLKLAKMSGNPINEWILSTFLKNMSDYYDTYTDKENQFSHENWQNQKRMVQAIKDKNPKEAARQAQVHLELGSKHVEGGQNKALGN